MHGVLECAFIEAEGVQRVLDQSGDVRPRGGRAEPAAVGGVELHILSFLDIARYTTPPREGASQSTRADFAFLCKPDSMMYHDSILLLSMALYDAGSQDEAMEVLKASHDQLSS